MPSRCKYTEPSNAMDAVCAIVAARYSSRKDGHKAAVPKGVGAQPERGRRKDSSRAAPYPPSSHVGSDRRVRDPFTPPPLTDASSVASSSSPRTPPLRHANRSFTPSSSSAGSEHHSRAMGYAASPNLPHLTKGVDVLNTASYGQLALLDNFSLPWQDDSQSTEQVDDVFEMFLNEGYYGDAAESK